MAKFRPHGHMAVQVESPGATSSHGSFMKLGYEREGDRGMKMYMVHIKILLFIFRLSLVTVSSNFSGKAQWGDFCMIVLFVAFIQIKYADKL